MNAATPSAPAVMTDSIDSYETHADKFLRYRDTSTVGIQVTDRWARSLSPTAEVIEIACGGGLPVTRTLVEAELKVWAIDASPTLLAVFRERFPGIPAQCASALESDYFHRQFDAAIAIGLLFLLNESDQIRLLNRVAAVLRPGARFLFTAPVEAGSWTDIGTGHSCLSLGREVYEQALGRAGFSVVGHHEDEGQNHYYEAETAERGELFEGEFGSSGVTDGLCN